MITPAVGPKVTLWDIETTHNLAAVFRLLNQDMIPAENIIKERYVVCASWKTLGEPEVYAVSTLDAPRRFKKDPSDDFYVIKTLHHVLSQSDVIIAHNGDAYDIKFTETRMLKHGLEPLPPILKIDTLKAARDRFLFNANNLDYLGNFLGVGRKKPTTSGLWLRVLQGDPEAIQEMVGYNKQDVLLLERVFLKLQPYMANHINRQLFPGAVGKCPRCDSSDVQSRGTHRALTQSYQRFYCNACGGWFRNSKSTSGTKTRVL